MLSFDPARCLFHMKKNYYHDYSIKDLGEAYHTMRANDAIDSEMLDAINERGGEEHFLAQLRRAEALSAEKIRIGKEVDRLMAPGVDAAFIRKMIHSNLMTASELDVFVAGVYDRLLAYRFNRRVDADTLIRAGVGLIAATVVAGGLWLVQYYMAQQAYILSLVPIFCVCLLLLRFLTRKNAANIIVLITTLIATILGPLLVMIYF